MAIEGILTELLLAAVASTTVDVVSQRTIDPRIKGIGRAYRILGVLDTATSIANAVRVTAYWEAASIVASEVIIDAVNANTTKLLGSTHHINFELVRQVEGILLEQDRTDEIATERSKLDPIYCDKAQGEFIEGNWETCGRNLIDITWPCVERAITASGIAEGIASTPDAAQPRWRRNWDRNPSWIDKINTGLGYAIWVPTPVIGVGTGIIYNDNKYTGIFRKDNPEGYGTIYFSDGSNYKGQVLHNDIGGYGVLRQADGTIMGGHFCKYRGVLGALVTPNRSMAIAGSHRIRGGTFGYARQVGMTENTPSQSGFWQDGKITHPIVTRADHLSLLKARFRSAERRHGAEIIKRSEVAELGRRQSHADSSISQMASELMGVFRE